MRLERGCLALFIHIAPEKRAKLILRSGIRCRRSADPAGRVVFAMPVVPNYFVSHQWLRELKRSGQRTLVAIHFRIPDDERVLVGHYGGEHLEMTAAEALAHISANDSEGYEVLVGRKIQPGEIHAVRAVRQVLGWRYSPSAHETRPCGCSYCQRGQVGAKKLRAKYEKAWLERPR